MASKVVKNTKAKLISENKQRVTPEERMEVVKENLTTAKEKKLTTVKCFFILDDKAYRKGETVDFSGEEYERVKRFLC